MEFEIKIKKYNQLNEKRETVKKDKEIIQQVKYINELIYYNI